MIHPDLKTFRRLARKSNLIAVTGTIPADLETPVSSFLKVAGKDPETFLLESAEQEEHTGRYSIIGLHPALILESDSQGRVFEIRKGSSKRREVPKELTGALAEKLEEFRLANPEDIRGFSGGFVGYLSYENVQYFEDIRLYPRKGPEIPQGVFLFCEDLLIFDHFRKQLHLVALIRLKGGGAPEKGYRSGVRRIQRLERMLRKPLPVSRQNRSRSAVLKMKSNVTASGFEEKVRRVKKYIREGDCIQVVLSQRFSAKVSGDDFRIYRALRSINPSPYMFYFRYGDLRLVGSSPELMVRKEGRKVSVRPIAGTRPRGNTRQEDLKYEDSLKRSPKELAEHLMLVDLGRNDLGRVAEFESIEVKDYAHVERFSHVMHLVSDVTGRLKRGKTAFDVLKAAFPAGTVTGAPKIRAMEIINELEPERRGPYSGCVGYFSFTGDMDTCIAIRTLVIYRGRVYVQAGAGIVKDSHPSKEYEETVNKAKALMKAIEARESF